jgi:Fic family protein
MGPRQETGKWVSVDGLGRAFVPNALPPELHYDSELVMLLSNADRALGGVSSIAGFVPNPYLFILAFRKMEAMSSARIEGTQTTPEETLQAELSALGALSDDQREVTNYLRAMARGIQRIETIPLSLRVVRELHKVLLEGSRGQNRAPGEFRRVPVHVGPPGLSAAYASYVPPPPQLVPELMGDWEKFVHAPVRIPPLVKCALLHAQFEMIHPFLDGNGRIGRLLMSLCLVAWGHLTQPVLFLSPYLERHRDEYYSRLQAISQHGDWRGWLGFFLRGVKVQSVHAERMARRILDARDEARSALQNARASGPALRALDLMCGSPYVMVPMVAERLEISHNTAAAAIAKLEEIGFVEEITGKRRGRIYRATRLVELIKLAGEAPEDETAEQPTLPLG